jgi:hypothetical protein
MVNDSVRAALETQRGRPDSRLRDEIKAAPRAMDEKLAPGASSLDASWGRLQQVRIRTAACDTRLPEAVRRVEDYDAIDRTLHEICCRNQGISTDGRPRMTSQVGSPVVHGIDFGTFTSKLT